MSCLDGVKLNDDQKHGEGSQAGEGKWDFTIKAPSKEDENKANNAQQEENAGLRWGEKGHETNGSEGEGVQTKRGSPPIDLFNVF
uniref:Uncharacterized protein n=1 Tax=uncultured organism MedDCM-OCT-S11-C492 TaxID=743663 RepID=D6PLK3_9ZZZZ|nr:hypothetical protein [uncultured organism MedDCM-OCT-S11-C492]